MGVEAVIATQVIDTTSVGRAVMTAANAAAARSAIGAGTSSFDGAYSSLSGIPSTFAPSSHTHTASAITDFSEAVDDEVATLLTAGTNITITYNDAANTLTVAASGGSPGGSSGQMQFNNAGAFGGAAAVAYATTGTHLVVTAQGATIVPICAKGAASQSANIFEAQNSGGTKLFYVTPGGAVVAAGVAWTGKTYYQDGYSSVGWGLSAGNWYFGNGSVDWKFGLSTGGVQIFSGTLGFNNNAPGSGSDAGVSRNAAGVIEVNNGTAGTFRDLLVRNLGLNGAVSAGGGVGIAFLANATTVPTTNPTGGGVLYCEGGALKFRGSSGTVTTLGPA